MVNNLIDTCCSFQYTYSNDLSVVSASPNYKDKSDPCMSVTLLIPTLISMYLKLSIVMMYRCRLKNVLKVL